MRLFRDSEHFGRLHHLGLAMFGVAFGLAILSFLVPGRDGVSETLNLSQILIGIGFVVAALADILARRPFSWERLGLALVMWMGVMILMPVFARAGIRAHDGAARASLYSRR